MFAPIHILLNLGCLPFHSVLYSLPTLFEVVAALEVGVVLLLLVCRHAASFDLLLSDQLRLTTQITKNNVTELLCYLP